jgi:uncharacterized protein (TIGR03437 family)
MIRVHAPTRTCGFHSCALRAKLSTMSMRISCGIVALVACALLPLRAGTPLTLSPDGITVYDTVNNISWLADFNLGASNRFGLPLCATVNSTVPCVNPSGSMNWVGAVAWVAAMNAANYLGHTDWQLPTTPFTDQYCGGVGPQGNSFGAYCSLGALESLYYNALGLTFPNTAVPISHSHVGPFGNLQPYFYWSQSGDGGLGQSVFSFGAGSQGGNTTDNFQYVLPMIRGKIPGTPAASGMGLQVNPGGQTVYDPMGGVTWLTNANLAATNTFGLPLCTQPTGSSICAAQDGSMNLAGASQFIANMNAYNGSGYLGQTNWELPPSNPGCPTYNCAGMGNPMGILYYDQFGLSAATPAVPTPNVAVGRFRNLQPYIYWSCQSVTLQNPIQDQCDGVGPNKGMAEWAFSFGNGFLGTDGLEADYYVTAYFVGSPNLTTGPAIAEVANAESGIPIIAPNTWIVINGANLARDSRFWQLTDLLTGHLPTQLDGVSVTVNGKSAYVYEISPSQLIVLTPPDAISGLVSVAVTNNGSASAPFNAQAASISPSLFVASGGQYVVSTPSFAGVLGLLTLVPGFATPVHPGQVVSLFGDGFGPTSTPVVSGSLFQFGSLSPKPAIAIGGVAATVQSAGLVAPGVYQFNVAIPSGLANGDQPIVATFDGQSTQPGTLITIHN